MSDIEIFQSLKTQEQAVEYLEKVRWRGHPICPYCSSVSTCRHVSGDRAGQRWQCQDCSRAFAVTVGTIFHGTHIPLRNWFLVIALMLNAKKSASACQIARDLGMRRPTVWSMMHRVRIAMASNADQSGLLHEIVGADETYIGGKPRKGSRRDGDKPNRRGRGTSKAAVHGVVERGERGMAKPAKKGDLSNKGLAKFIEQFVDTAASLLFYVDEYSGYKLIGVRMKHATINRSYEYANGDIHTNNIGGLWALVRRAWYQQRHHYSRKYMPLYISEACYKYNRRNKASPFKGMLVTMVGA